MFEIVFCTHKQVIPASTVYGSQLKPDPQDLSPVNFVTTEPTQDSPFLLNWQLVDFTIEDAADEINNPQVVKVTCPELVLCESCRCAGTFSSIVRNFFGASIDIAPFIVERIGSCCNMLVRNKTPYDYVFDEGDWVALVQSFCMCKSRRIGRHVLNSWNIGDLKTKSPHKTMIGLAYNDMYRQLVEIRTLSKTSKHRLHCKKPLEKQVVPKTL